MDLFDGIELDLDEDGPSTSSLKRLLKHLDRSHIGSIIKLVDSNNNNVASVLELQNFLLSNTISKRISVELQLKYIAKLSDLSSLRIRAFFQGYNLTAEDCEDLEDFCDKMCSLSNEHQMRHIYADLSTELRKEANDPSGAELFELLVRRVNAYKTVLKDT